MLLLIGGLIFLVACWHLSFVFPYKHIQEKKQMLKSALHIGQRIKTYTGHVGTIHHSAGNQLTIFFDDGNRKIIPPEHVVAIINE
jgi:preprotein translocase subunit YajC